MTESIKDVLGKQNERINKCVELYTAKNCCTTKNRYNIP